MVGTKAAEFLRSIARELGMESETSAESILKAYLSNDIDKDIFMSQIERKGSVNRILIVGQTGAGKSSLVNLLAAKQIAEVSDGANGCTFKYQSYLAIHNRELYELIDTVGLNEGSKGTVNPNDSMKMLINFIRGNKRGFSCILFVMPKGRLTDSFEKNHMLFYQTLLNCETPAILFVSHCESDDPIDKWIKKPENRNALDPYKFSDIVCGTSQEGGRFASLLQPLRDETRRHLWESIADHMLEAPLPIKATLNAFKRLWNAFCDFSGFSKKFLTNQFASLLQYLRTMGVEEETIQQINLNLH